MAEIAYLGRVMHWPLSDLLDLEHGDRRRLIELTVEQDVAASRSQLGYEA